MNSYQFIRRGVAAVLAATLLFTNITSVQASQEKEAYKQSSESVSENNFWQPEEEEGSLKQDEAWESVSGNYEEEKVSESVSVNLVEEQVLGTISANSFILSEEERQQKEELEEHLPAIGLLEEGKDFVKGEILVMAENEEKAIEYAKAFGGTLQDYFAPIALIELPQLEEGGLTVQEVVLASAREEINLPAAWPNYYRYPDTTEDPFLTESNEGYQWYHGVVGSKKAWEAGYQGAGIKVAVLDSGIESNVADLSATTKIVNDTLGSEDNHGHGTHVAGIIGAKYNNGSGGVGIAPQSQIISVKVISDLGVAESADIIRGIQLAMEAGADIINMSLGSGAYSEAEQAIVSEAYSKGIAVICSAGNSNSTAPHYPAGYEGAIAIAALDKNSHKASFSNSGSYVRYSAPGVAIVSTSLDGLYESLQGTSQAAPIVSGIAAVLLSSGVVEGSGIDRLNNLLNLMDQSCEKVVGTGLGKGNVSLIKALQLNPVSANPVEPQISHDSGVYKKEELRVTITAAAGSEIYYTLDGKNISFKDGTISKGAQKYLPGTEIVIEGKSSITLKAIAINPENSLSSKVVTGKYTLKPVASDLVDRTSVV